MEDAEEISRLAILSRLKGWDVKTIQWMVKFGTKQRCSNWRERLQSNKGPLQSWYRSADPINRDPYVRNANLLKGRRP